MMDSQIKIIKTSSKLPGYLFVLTGISNIGDSVCLHCSKNSYEFLNSMLRMIGLKTQLMKKANKKSNLLIVIDSCQEIKTIKPLIEKGNFSLIYISDSIYLKKLLTYTKKIILQYPHCILVSNIKISVSKKEFFILVNSHNSYYKKINKHVELWGSK